MGHKYIGISISTAAARERLESDPTGAVAALADVQQSAQATMVEIDALLHQLSPAPLATIGLLEALGEQCEALSYRTGATVTTTFGDLPPAEQLPTGTQEALFRMAQEALSNVARHARASAVQVQLEVVADEKLLRLEVQDNGQGFTPTVPHKGMGLANLQARAASVNGRVELHSMPSQGTRVRIDIPLTAHGRTNRAIAEALVITEETVKTHVGNILAKLQLAHRTQAALYALKQGLVELEEIEL